MSKGAAVCEMGADGSATNETAAGLWEHLSEPFGVGR